MTNEKIISAIDLGTNSVLMLIAKCNGSKSIKPINEYIANTQLGEQASATNLLTSQAIDRTLAAVGEMQKIAFNEGTEHLIVTATSAVRNAENKTRFLVKCHQQLKIYPQVLSGKEEAKLTFIGATSELPNEKPVVLIDIGGGSSEIAYGYKGNMKQAYSIDVGCVKLAELFNIKEKLTLTKQFSAQNYIRRNLLPFKYEIGDWALKNNPEVIISGGTASTYAAILKKQLVYDRYMINMTKSTCKEAITHLKTLGKSSIYQRRQVPGMEIERAEILPAGLLIMTTILNFFSFSNFTITTDGLRLGSIKYYLDSDARS